MKSFKTYLQAQVRHLGQRLDYLPAKQRLAFSLTALISLSYSWYFLTILPFADKRANTAQRLQHMQKHIAQLANDTQTILELVQKPANPELVATVEQLKINLAEIDKKLALYSRHIIEPQHINHVLSALATQQPGLTINQLEKSIALPVLTPAATTSPPTAPATTLAAEASAVVDSLPLFRQNFTINLQGNYFATLKYLQNLEQLPWQLVWDELDYQVTHYPIANIHLKMHSLSNQEDSHAQI